MRVSTSPVTFRQALVLADNILHNAYDFHVRSLAGGHYATGAEQRHRLTDLGRITMARWELGDLGPALVDLRRTCTRVKSAKAVLNRLVLNRPALSAVAREAVHRLPALAAELAHQRGVRYPAATARAHTAAVAALLERLPAALVRLRELAEAGASLTPAATWLK